MRRKIEKMVRELSLVWKMCKTLPFRCVVRNAHFLETCTCVSCWMHDNGNVIHHVTEKEGNKDLKLLIHNNSLFILDSLRGILPLLRVAHCSVEVSGLRFVSSPQVGAHMCFTDTIGIHISLEHS